MTIGTFTSPAEDIIVQEGTFAYDFIASGAIKAGQCLTAGPAAMTTELPVLQDDAFIGVAAYTIGHGDHIAVYGPGNIVRCIVSGASVCTVGDDLYIGDALGKVNNVGTTGTHRSIGVALETQNTADGTVRVLLK